MPSARRAPILFVVLFLVFTLLLCGAVGILTALFADRATYLSPTAGTTVDVEAAVSDDGSAPTAPPLACVVIDAGHGGEDGGAVSADGLCEKDVNLAVAVYLRELFEAAGVPTVMTRTEDQLLYDRTANYKGRKKMLDLAARRAVAEATEGCLFISIHMNAFTDPRYSGMQVWYGIADSRSRDIAHAIQLSSVMMMPDNTRAIKAADSRIYLLDRITAPAVLVECGFLSNPAEAARLAEADYQRAVAFCIFGAVMPYMAE